MSDFDTQIQADELFCHIFSFGSYEELEEFEKAIENP